MRSAGITPVIRKGARTWTGRAGRGFSIDRSNYIAGVTIVAVPILDPEGRDYPCPAAVGPAATWARDASLALVQTCSTRRDGRPRR